MLCCETRPTLTVERQFDFIEANSSNFDQMLDFLRGADMYGTQVLILLGSEDDEYNMDQRTIDMVSAIYPDFGSPFS